MNGHAVQQQRWCSGGGGGGGRQFPADQWSVDAAVVSAGTTTPPPAAGCTGWTGLVGWSTASHIGHTQPHHADSVAAPSALYTAPGCVLAGA